MSHHFLPHYAVQMYCSHNPFDTKNRVMGGGSARGTATPIDSGDGEELKPATSSLQSSPQGSSVDLTGAPVGGGMGGVPSFGAGDGGGTGLDKPTAMDNFVGLARDPKGAIGRSMVKGWKDGVSINAAEHGGSQGFLDTLGSGFSGALGGAKREVQGAFSNGAVADNAAFAEKADAARKSMSDVAANGAAEAAKKAAADAVAKRAAEELAKKLAAEKAAQLAASQAASAGAASAGTAAAAGASAAAPAAAAGGW